MRFGIETITIFIFLMLALAGCVELQAMMVLKRLGDSQAEIERYLAKQQQLFNKLVSDVKEGKLQKGISKSQILKTYGDPVLASRDESLPQQEILLYRHPTEYFTSDRIRLYFDGTGKLIRWEYKPYQKSG